MESIDTVDNITSSPGSKILKFARPDLTKDECIAVYDKWATSPYSYDDHAIATTTGAQMAADKVAEVLADRKSARILDVAAGTGHVGYLLKDLGFTNMDALEPSDGMFKVAEQRNAYKKRYPYFLDDKAIDIPSDSYDLIVICGAFADGHIPNVAIKEMIRVIKSGGLWVNVMREEYLRTSPEYQKLEAFMQELVEEGLWTPVSRTVKDNYAFETPGVIHVYQIA